ARCETMLDQRLVPTMLTRRRDPDIAMRFGARIHAPPDIVPVMDIGVGVDDDDPIGAHGVDAPNRLDDLHDLAWFFYVGRHHADLAAAAGIGKAHIDHSRRAEAFELAPEDRGTGDSLAAVFHEITDQPLVNWIFSGRDAFHFEDKAFFFAAVKAMGLAMRPFVDTDLRQHF